MGRVLGGPVLLKMEALQPSGSFKLRGVGRLCQEAAAGGARSLVASSGGNAGLAAAYAGRKLGLPTTVVVPKTTPEWMRERLRGEGATVIEHGAAWDDAHGFASVKAEAEGGAYIHPFDHPALWAGNATMIHEMQAQGPKPGAVVCAVGGGGLLCGVVQGLHETGWGDVPVLAVETEGAASYKAALDAGGPVALAAITSLATSLGARKVSQEAFGWSRRHAVTPHVVSDARAVAACLRFAEDHRVLVEPGCGAALSAVYDGAPALKGLGSVAVIVCGGAAVTPAKLEEWRTHAA